MMFRFPASDVFKRLDEQQRGRFPSFGFKFDLADKLSRQLKGEATDTDRSQKPIGEKLAPLSLTERADRQEEELRRVAASLLEQIGKGKYKNSKITNLIIEMLFRAEKGLLAATFEAEKTALRRTVQRAEARKGKRAGEFHYPSLSRFNQVINSLEPIYQRVQEALRSTIDGKSEAEF
jgi:hypothetical protein